MRSPIADAAIVAAPALIATYLAVWCGDALLAPSSGVPALLATHAVMGLVLARLTHQTVIGMLGDARAAARAGLRLFLFLAVLTALLAAPDAPEAARHFAAAALGVAACLHLLGRATGPLAARS